MPWEIASLGHSGSQTSQLMHSSVMIRATATTSSGTRRRRAGGELGSQARGDRRAHEVADVAAETGDFPYDRRGHEQVFFGRGQEQRFDFRVEVPVHSRHLKLV